MCAIQLLVPKLHYTTQKLISELIKGYVVLKWISQAAILSNNRPFLAKLDQYNATLESTHRIQTPS